MKPIVLVGPGGHCRSCIDVIETTQQFEIVAIVGQPNEVGQEILGYAVTNTDSDMPMLVEKHRNFLITVGQIKSNTIRVKLFGLIKKLGGEFPTIVSPRAHASKHATVGEGSIVMHSAIVNAAATIGENCIINSRALIEHDAQVGNHCHVSTGAIINGGTIVEPDCFIGSGATTREGIVILRGTIVGAGSWYDGKQRQLRTSRERRD